MEEKKNQALNDAVENEENVAVAAESGPASDDLCLLSLLSVMPALQTLMEFFMSVMSNIP